MAVPVKFGGRKTREGVVVSDKMDKTVVVAVETHKRHRLYRKIIRRVTRYKAHDEENACHTGDRVRIVESRPLSRDKRWQVAEVLARSELPEVPVEEVDVELAPEEPIAEPAAAEAPAEAPAEAEEVAEEATFEEVEAVEEAAAGEEPAVEAEQEPAAAAVEEEAPVEAAAEEPEETETDEEPEAEEEAETS